MSISQNHILGNGHKLRMLYMMVEMFQYKTVPEMPRSSRIAGSSLFISKSSLRRWIELESNHKMIHKLSVSCFLWDDIRASNTKRLDVC